MVYPGINYMYSTTNRKVHANSLCVSYHIDTFEGCLGHKVNINMDLDNSKY